MKNRSDEGLRGPIVFDLMLVLFKVRIGPQDLDILETLARYAQAAALEAIP